MFPEITRDEVFRIETPRLWLRWPVRADAVALAAIMAQACQDGGASIANVNVQAINKLIVTWRADMDAGAGLHLVLALKSGARTVVGVIHSGADRTCVAREHRKLENEATDALREMSAWLGVRPLSRRVPPMAQQRVFTPTAAVAVCCMQA